MLINKNKLLVILAFSLIAFLYLHDLSRTPVYLNQDELMFGLNARSISLTGNDFYGNKLPFYFWHLDNFWATPIVVYWSAVFLKFLPLTEFAIRIPTVVLGLISAFTFFFLVQIIFNNKKLSLLGSLLIMAAPAFYINSRLLLDNIYPVFFVILWLLLLNNKKYFWTGIVLGLGIHSYHASKIYFPLYFLATLIYINVADRFNFKKNLLLVFGFLVPIFIFLPWLKVHPDTLLNQVSYVSSIDSSFSRFNILGITTRYLSYFDPRALFFEGDKTLVHSTGRFGVFLFPVSMFLVFGILDVLRNKDAMSKMVLFGFLSYPIAPSLINDPQRISRALIVIPFGVLLSIYGIRFLFKQKDRVFKLLVYGALILNFLLFIFFLTDYFGDYRSRSYGVFNRDIGGAMESVLKSTKTREVDKIYLDKYIPYVNYYYVFYEKKLGITFDDIKDYDFKKDSFSDLPAKSLLVISQKIKEANPIEIIREPDSNESYFIYEKR